MKNKSLILLFLLLLASSALAPTVYAQSTPDFNFQDIINALGPRNTMPELLFDILLYAIFGIGFVTMLLIPDKQLMPSLLMIAVLGLTVIAKLDIFDPTELIVLALNVGIFVIPLIVAGMLRARPGKMPAALWPAILTGLVGGGYFFIFWAMAQRVE